MLSTALSVDPSPAPAFSPTGRTPDTGQIHNATPAIVVPTTTKEPSSMTAMVVDSSAGKAVLGAISAAAETNANAGNQLTLTTSPPPQASTAQIHPFSYASALTGGQLVPTSQPLAIQWTPVGEHDLIPGERNGEPALSISPEFKNRLCAPWHRTLVVRLLVQQWTPRFKVSDPLPKTMIVWVHVPELKIHFYHKEVLNSLGNLIGRTIKLDYHTLTQQREKFARLAVEVDISKPLVPRIWLDDDWQPVEYENLPFVCFECGKIGHAFTVCSLLRPASVPELVESAGGEKQDLAPEGTSETNAGFGPWMLVSHKGRPNQRETSNKGKQRDSGATIQVITPRNGKNGTKSKEPRDSLPILDQQSSPPPQRSSGQERKRNGEIQNGTEKRNGKGIMREEESPAGKGILGPDPSLGPVAKKGLKPKSDALKASTSGIQSETPLIPTSGPNRGTTAGPQAQ
ncbi:unnamed protein product, partial [Linum tenue]